MINVDTRTGSADLIPYLRKLGLPVLPCRLPFGDASFIGNGPEGLPITVGVEVKSFRDVLSCMTDGRFSGHQLPGMIQSYQVPWLLVVGQWRRNPQSGILEYRKPSGQWFEATVGTRRFMWKDLETWFCTVQAKTGLNLHRCFDWSEAVHWIGTLYRWWTEKQYEDHRGHLSIHNTRGDLFDRAILTRPSLCRLVALQLPGIGTEKSLAVANHFGTVDAMVGADISDWCSIDGIGRTLAERIYYALRSESA